MFVRLRVVNHMLHILITSQPHHPLMKRLISIFLLLTAFITAKAELSEKAIRDIIIKCDVADTVLQAPDAPTFWQLLRHTNPEFRKTAKSLASSGDRDIKRELINELSNCDQYFRTVPTAPGLYDLSEHIVESSGIRAISPTATLTITDESDIAVFGYPNGYLFMTGGLHKAVTGDTTVLRSLFAAEAAHYALQHAYAHNKYEKKRRNRHRFWRIFGAVALTGASVLADNATDGYFPVELGLMAATAIATTDVVIRYPMRYTPMQIYEADIVAYRYCQLAFGSGLHYIMALRLVGNDLDASAAMMANAPTVADRISVLQYLDTHPEIRSRVKSRNTRPKYLKKYFDPFLPSNYR